MKKIAAITYGCKINQYETACIVDDFCKHGFSVVDFREKADVYLINSCTVTNRTDYKSRNAVRKALKAKKENPNVKIIVTGCYAQRNFSEISALGDIDFIVDNNSKSKIFHKLQASETEFFDVLSALEFDELSTEKMLERTRAYIKVQDGCDYYCAYCAIPFARGHSRSRAKENVLSQIRKLVAHGYKEFVLGGINLGLYGKEKNENYLLADLLADIEKSEGVELIRLSSIEPELFTPSLLEFIESSRKIAPHFHIPLQVGSDFLLKKMKRHYTTIDFRKTLGKLRSLKPNAAFGIDVIAGLPGESEELFRETLSFLNSLDFTYLHVFSYSRRPGTEAAKMKNQINGDEINRRSGELIKISEEKKEKYLQKIIEGKITLAGVMETSENGFWTALSDHYLRIYFPSSENLKGQFLRFKPVGKFNDGIEVELFPSQKDKHLSS